jgi:hypothetical protein
MWSGPIPGHQTFLLSIKRFDAIQKLGIYEFGIRKDVLPEIMARKASFLRP